MGMAYGLAALIGVGAAQSSKSIPIVTVLACMVAFVFLSPSTFRPAFVAGVAGLLCGLLAAEIQDGASASTLDTPYPNQFQGRIGSDPRAGDSGLHARFLWTGPDGIPRESRVFFSPTIDAGRGDLVYVTGEIDGPGATRIFAESAKIRERADGIEVVRREIRQQISDRILLRTPGSNGSLALGLLIGDDSGLTSDERDAMRASGLSHITAVSGSNVALLIGFVALLTRALVGRSYLLLGIQVIAILIYVWIVGFEPPIVRGAVMGSLVLVAIVIGRPSHFLTLLLLTGAGMAMLDPDILGSLSFQLSFLSMFAIGVIGFWATRAENIRRRVLLVLAVPSAAAVATAPLIAMRFGTFSLGTVPANILVASLILPATLLAGVVAIVSSVPILGFWAGTVLWLITGAILEVARGISSIPGAYWRFSPPSPGVAILAYVVLAALAAPLVPEVRLGIFKFRRWAGELPVRAFASAFAGLAVLWLLATMSN